MRLALFVQSSDIQSVIVIAKQFNKLPSEVIKIKDEYLAYCFDEAVAYIIQRIEDGETPNFNLNKKDVEKPKIYHSFSSVYSKYNNDE